MAFLQFIAITISWLVSMNRNNIEKTLPGKEVRSYKKHTSNTVIFKSKAVSIASFFSQVYEYKSRKIRTQILTWVIASFLNAHHHVPKNTINN